MMKIGILKNEVEEDHFPWIKACEKYKNIIDYGVVDLTASDWMEKLEQGNYDFLLAKPSGMTAGYKQVYDERIFIIDNVLKIHLFPSALEIYIYENKRFLNTWLMANDLPHPRTTVFFHKNEAVGFVNQITWPLVAKVNIGASGSGVKILHDKGEAFKYIEQSFSSKGAPRRWGPNLSTGNLLKRGFHYLLHPQDIRKKMAKYTVVKADKQKGFVLFQEYIPHDFEWRIVVIGDSYFAHKKMKMKEKASGSLLKAYDNPPTRLFDFAKGIMEKFSFTSQAIDVFEKSDGDLLINEMQCIFGQSDPYQMLVDGKPGRYCYKNEKWWFEPGDFNTNECYDLRLRTAIELYNKGRA